MYFLSLFVKFYFKAFKKLHEILFCVGDYTDVVAIHPHDLNVLYTLNSRAEPDWLNSITLVKPNDKIGGCFLFFDLIFLFNRCSNWCIFIWRCQALVFK
jgi:hypothetical protein